MKHRAVFSEKERNARSRTTQLIHKTLIVGGMVEMVRKCGKPNCKCATGEKHKSWCVSLRHKGKRKMVHIPRACEEEIFEGIKNYQEIWEQMSIISDSSLERILSTRKSKEQSILRRILRYSDKIFNLKAHIKEVRDNRVRPRIKTSTVISSILVMKLSRMKNFNALAQTKSCFLRMRSQRSYTSNQKLRPRDSSHHPLAST